MNEAWIHSFATYLLATFPKAQWTVACRGIRRMEGRLVKDQALQGGSSIAKTVLSEMESPAEAEESKDSRHGAANFIF